MKNDILDKIYSSLYIDFDAVERYVIDGDRDYFIDNYKVESPEEISYAIVRTASALYHLTGEERFKELSIKAGELYTKLKDWALPAFHI